MSISPPRNTLIVCIAAIGIAAGTSTAFAQSVSDFKEASEKSGCRLIPYSSPRGSCEDLNPKVEEYCKRRPWKCDDLNPDGLKRNIENVSRKLEDLRKEQDNLKSKKSSATEDSERRDLESKIKDLEDKIKELENKIEDWRKTLESEKKQINDRLDTGKQCRSYREDVAKIFRDAKSNLQSENDEEKKLFARKIIEKITAEEPGHKDIIDKVTEGIRKCEGMR